ncbi:hypothetical protein GUJ93_ZPchr0010g8372 [Zizania palustris]|uniref:Reticulon-like protein n=1 Tax=Zizania palustris TaxID=103762 RepID=A0A8J5WA39_ZIZPA|nr:hypothetical protein GUJ93_ZPchr0010g8372 [Zizania palustris]
MLTAAGGGGATSARPPSSSVQQRQRQGNRRAETLRLRRVFEMFDRDGDGVITPAELSGALVRLGGARQEEEAPPGPAALDAVVAAYIAPGMAGLRFVDFEALHAELAGDRDHQLGDDAAVVEDDDDDVDMREAFGVFDENGDGYISATELQSVLSRMGLPEAACMARVRDMIAAADRDSDGLVNYEEFKAMMAGGRGGEGMVSESEEHGSLLEKINQKIHEYKGSSSSSDSDDDTKPHKSKQSKKKKKKLFGRQHPLHHVLGGGKAADIVLWRDKHKSGSILAGVTVVWLLFEGIGYHLLTLCCHSLIVFLTVCFVWSNAASFINRSPPKFPDVILSEAQCLKIAHLLRKEINEAFFTLRNVASGKDLKTYLLSIGGLWFISIIGSCFSFLTLSYTIFVMAYTLPMLYEKYEDEVDDAGEKALVEIKKQYAVLDHKLLSKIPCYLTRSSIKS